MDSVNETPFRVAFGFIWALNFALRIYFQARARTARKSFARHEQRARVFFRLLVFAYLSMLVYILSTWFDFAHVNLPVWARWFIGIGILVAYLALFSWAHDSLGRNWSGLLEIHEDHALVTNGPYRYVRHPMYSGFFLSGLGFFVLSANWFIAALYLLAVILMCIDRVSSEEEMMIERFGDSYKGYMKSTGRLLPRLRM